MKASLRPEKLDFQLERANLKPESAEYKSERADIGFKIADFCRKSLDLGSERASLRPRKPRGGGNTNGRTKAHVEEEESGVKRKWERE